MNEERTTEGGLSSPSCSQRRAAFPGRLACSRIAKPDGLERPPSFGHHLCALILFLFFFALRIAAATPSPQQRVVSQTVGSDEMLLALAAPSQIAALSHLAQDPQFSAVSTEARAYPILTKNGDSESVLAHAPTLVLFANYSRIELVEQVRRAGVRVLIFDRYDTLEDAYTNLRTLARELGPEAETRAERLIADCQRRVTDLAAKLKNAHANPVRVIAPSTYGMIPGDQSTFQDICDHAGAENLAATLGKLHGHAAPPTEQMLSWPVDKVVLPFTLSEANHDRAAAEKTALAPFVKLPPYQYMEAVRKSRVAFIERWQISCTTHRRVDAYEQLARELHPEIFANVTGGRSSATPSSENINEEQSNTRAPSPSGVAELRPPAQASTP